MKKVFIGFLFCLVGLAEEPAKVNVDLLILENAALKAQIQSLQISSRSQLAQCTSFEIITARYLAFAATQKFEEAKAKVEADAAAAKAKEESK